MSKVRRHNKKRYSDWVNFSISFSPRVCGWAEALGLWVTVETCMLWNALVQSRCPVCVSSDRVESERKSLSSRCASHERTRPHLGPVSTHYPTQAVSSSWLYGQIESKFPNASEDAQEEEWAPLSGLRLTADSRQVSQSDASCLPQQYIVPSQHYG